MSAIGMGEGSKVGQNCLRIVQNNCWHEGGGCQSFGKITDIVYGWSQSKIEKQLLSLSPFSLVQVNLCQKLFFLQNMRRTCCVKKFFWMSETISVHNMFSPGLSLEFSCIELVIQWTISCKILSYCGLVDAKIRTSDKDLPVIFLVGVIATSSGVMTIFLGFGVSVLILIDFKLVLANSSTQNQKELKENWKNWTPYLL